MTAPSVVLENLRDPERFDHQSPGLNALDAAVDAALATIKTNLDTFGPGLYPPPNSHQQRYSPIANTDWTSSFWTGQLWLAYELTGDETYREQALAHLPDYRHRLDSRTATDTHDLGFLFTLSGVAAWRLTGSVEGRRDALKAADLLMLRYFEKAGVIQAWGDLNDPARRGRIIIDCAMNLPLLFWAAEQTGNSYYREAALTHLANANKTLIRSDASTFHTYYFDVERGTPLRGQTAQGYSDSSCWARGQAWGILGLSLSYRYLGDANVLEQARTLAHYFLNRLPEDLVCYWDLNFTSGPEERDSSGAAIAACGLLELAKQLPAADPLRATYERAGTAIAANLIRGYAAVSPASNGLLLHGVYNKPEGAGVDECTAWGDYFYLELLMRLTRPWRPYW
jgi:unsaturated chondroitin disaccharide hydrolase